MKPKNAKPARAHGLPKIHKTFNNIPKFRPIIDTTGSSHYLVRKYLAQLLYPLKNNEFTLKGSSETVNLLMFPSKTLSMLYSHEYIMSTQLAQISKSVHSKNSLYIHAPKQRFHSIIQFINNKTVLAWVPRVGLLLLISN